MISRLRQALAWLDTPGAGRLIQVLMLVTFLTVAWLAVEQRRVDQCFDRYANAQAAATKARADSNAQADDAMEKLIAESLNGGPAYVAAAREWLAKYQEQKRAREANPVVEGPTSFCE